MAEVDGQQIQDIITKLRSETMKEYREYDGSNRLIALYQAHSREKNGGMCLLTEYSYYAGSSRERFKRESIASWDETWEVI